jgi:hypothetical protein
MTDNHGYNTPTKGTTDWHVPLNDNFEKLEFEVEIRDRESERGQYEPKSGAKFFSVDTGRIYIGTGDGWRRLHQTGVDPSFNQIEAEYARVKNRDNKINVRAIPGETLRERIVTALDLIETSGEIRIPRPEGGGVWKWGEELRIDVGEYKGITLNLDRGVEVEYGGEEWVLAVDNTNPGQKSTFAVEGIDAEFRATGNPEGCFRSDDLNHITIKTNTRYFENSSGDSTAVLIRNIDRFTEGWKLEGDHRANDRSVDFAPASLTGGGGTDSFVDGRAENLSLKGNDFGMRLRGNHKANIFDNVHFFYGADDAVGLVLDGQVSQAVFIGPRFDDTNGFENEVGIETRSEFKAYLGKPIFIGPEFSNVSTHAVKDEHIHDLWAVITDGSKAGFVDIESDRGLFANRGGGFTARNSTEEVFRVDGNGNVRAAGNWQTGSRPTFLDSLYFPTLSSDASPPAGKGILYVSDGSDGVTGDDGDMIVALADSDGRTKRKVLADFGEM